MKMQLPVFLAIFFLTGGCIKTTDEKAGVSLPQNLDLKTLSIAEGQLSFQLNGITFYGANGYYLHNDGYYPRDCVTPDGTVITYQAESPNPGILLGSTAFNCLIADLKNLPVIKKITVTLFNHNGANTRISICDGNGEMAQTSQGIAGPEQTEYVLDIAGKKVSKLMVSSLEAVVYSVRIE